MASSTRAIASPSGSPDGSTPSVSTVNEITTGRPTEPAARTTPIASSTYVIVTAVIIVGAGLGEGACLQAVVGRRLGRRHRLADHVAVAARADHAVDDMLDGTAGTAGGELSHELDRSPVDGGEPDRVVAEACAPVEVRPPRRRVDHHRGAEPPAEVEVGLVVVGERGATDLGVEQRERGEVGQVDAVVEDERRLESAVGDRQRSGELDQCHWISSLWIGARPVVVVELEA